jgi:cobalamin-dependent methionine synthase I
MMRTSTTGRRLIVIGENLHATRVVKRDGPNVTTLPDGRPAIAFRDAGGGPATLPLPAAMLDGADATSPRVKHVRAALLAGLAAEGSDEASILADAAAARRYVEAMAARQVAAGADYLDVNVDEVADDLPTRIAAMEWLVRTLTETSGHPLALDSSASEILLAGLDALPADAPRPVLNSASYERLDVLDLAAARRCPVVLSAAAGTEMPSTADAKVAAGTRILEAALERGIAPDACHVDVLVLPVAVDPEAGRAFLEAVARLRERHGPGVHLSGGLSNVSFGMPVRRILNEAFIDLALEAGLDSAIVDPVGTDLERAMQPDRTTETYRLAADALLGRDPYCVDFLTAYREGTLGTPTPA